MRYLIEVHARPLRRSCRCVGLSRAAYYRPPLDWTVRDAELIAALARLVEDRPSRGFGHVGKSLETFCLEQGVAGVRGNIKLDVYSYAQLLAKIALGFAVGETGAYIREENTPLLSIIRGESVNPTYWLGTGEFTLAIEAQRPMHAIGGEWIHSNDGAAGLIVNLKLFCSPGVPGHQIVAILPNWKHAEHMAPPVR